MKIKMILIVCVTAILSIDFINGNAQPADSIIYHQLINNKKVLGVHYAQVLFKNGKIKKEGWEYKKENNRTDGKYWGEQYDKYPMIIFRVGEWTEYYKSGKIKLKELIPFQTDSTRVEKHYNRKGELVAEFYFSGRDEMEYKLTEGGKRRKLKNYKKYEYRKGRLWLEESYKNGKKDGVWKEYIKEGQTMILEYKEGKRIRKEKSGAKF